MVAHDIIDRHYVEGGWRPVVDRGDISLDLLYSVEGESGFGAFIKKPDRVPDN